MRPGLLASLLLVSGPLTTPSIAQPAASHAPTSGPQPAYYYTEFEQRWYGWQTLAADVPLTVAIYGAQRAGYDGATYGFLGAFAVASPVIHWLHGNGVQGVVSLSAHGILPVGGYAVGATVVGALDPSSRTTTRNATGLALGALAAAALDSTLIAWDDVEVTRRFARTTPEIRVHPLVAVGPGTLLLGAGASLF